MSKLDSKREWVEEVSAAYNAGRPEPAWDQAGQLLDLLSVALDCVAAHPEAAADFEGRSQND